MRKIWAVTALLLLSGCGFSAVTDSPEQLTKDPESDLCFTYGATKRPEVKTELERRGVVDPKHWSTIDQEKVEVGFTECEAQAAWGVPAQINKTTTADGVGEQWVYGHYADALSFLYFSDGKVTTIQN